MHSQAVILFSIVTCIESDKNIIMEIIIKIDNLKLKLKKRMHVQYLPLIVCGQLKDLGENEWLV